MKVGGYEAIHGDVQRAYPLLRLLGTEFPRLACNPPFGLDWTLGGKRENSTLATWRMAMALLAGNCAGAFIAGRDRFAREVMPRPDAAGIYALVECPDLFERVELACTIAFFVAPDNVIEPREGGPQFTPCWMLETAQGDPEQWALHSFTAIVKACLRSPPSTK